MNEASDTSKIDDQSTIPKRSDALKFVVLLGFVSLLADITYEGARSITGPFLALLGANAAAVGIVAGAGELVGYGLRLVSGFITDRTKRYWTITLIGYSVNLIAVPLLALAGRWEIAAALMIMERVGKAIRTPARDAMLSHATKRIGTGWGFGLHEAMDQIGALTGPIIVATILYVRGDYRVGFIALAIPAAIAIAVVVAARFIYPDPSEFEVKRIELDTHAFPKRYWYYMAAVVLVAAGYADFPLIAYHFKKLSVVSDAWIPLFYSIAMGVDALAALIFGKLFDRIGMRVLIPVAIVSSLFAPLVFLWGFGAALVGMALWGIGMGAQESIMRAAVAEMVVKERRGSAYGIFNMGYGIFWFMGSALMGILYDVSIIAIVLFSISMQLASIPFLLIASKKTTQNSIQ